MWRAPSSLEMNLGSDHELDDLRLEVGGTCEQQRQACRGSAGQGGQGSPPGAPPQ